MILINKHKNLYIEFSDELLLKIQNHVVKHYPKEFGGLLIGKYSDDLKSLILTDILIPEEYTNHRTLFTRGTKGIQQKLIKMFKLKEKLYYVGEWHSHPNVSSRYSRTDLNAMKEIAKSESIRINNPVLLIVSIDNEKILDYTFYLYDNEKLIEYE
ncbi:Mov34/MPN/PAD-1 family protein [Riemerella columbina]|uniref:Mov34/MPN/PAD-1 family protein n=1 Tax=Riemerella columbina TaxID=103810 RepID=UPI00036EB738|nr:Mov34/MPN/PAD-1 family protein [Riemerella columbina]